MSTHSAQLELMRHMRAARRFGVAAGVLLGFALTSSNFLFSQTAKSPVPDRQSAAALLVRQPLHFEAVPDDSSHFVANGVGYRIAVAAGSFSLMGGDEAASVEATLVGASAAAAGEALNPLGAVSNYFLGADRAGWRAGVSQFGRVRYRGVYPGIDVVYYGNGDSLEHDFIVGPGADARRIRLHVAGSRPRLGAGGDMTIDTPAGAAVLHRPVAYQQTEDGERVAVDSTYAMNARGEIGFALGAYDRTRPLTIDPVLTYATTFGFLDLVNAVAVDGSGMIYVTGQAYTPFGITTKNPMLAAGTGTYNAFVTKINPVTNALVFSTFLGGNKNDEGFGIALDASGNVFVTGQTDSTNFPTLNAAQAALATSTSCSSLSSCGTAFVTALKGDGSALLYSTYLGGSTNEVGYGIAADASGNAYVTGITFSSNFPTKNAIYPTYNFGLTDAFVTKLNLAGQIQYSTFLGGIGSDAGYGIAVDATGAAYVTGSASQGFPIKNATKLAGTAIGNNIYGGGVMITEINAAGTALVFSNSIASGTGSAIALDASGAVYVTGTLNQPGQATGTYTPGFPTSAGAWNTTSGGSFLMKLAAGGATVAYSTLVGGNATDYVNGVAVDGSGDAWVAGYTTSNNLGMVTPVVAEGGGYFYASANGGTSFAAANQGLLPLSTQVIFDPNNPGTLTVAQNNAGSSSCTATNATCGGLYTSTNAGTNWTRSAPTGLTDVRMTQVARSKSTPTIVYALTPAGLFKSADNGATYAHATGTGIPTLTNPVFTIDPFTASTLYLESNSNVLYTSTDSGATWVANTTTFPANRNVGVVVADPLHQGLLYTTCNSLIWKTTNGGASWASLTTAFSPNGIVIDPSTPTTLYATTTFTPFYKSIDSGSTWTVSPASLSGTSGSLTVDPTNSQNVYVFFNPGFTYKSTNGGTSFSLTKFSGLPSIDPSNGQNLYVATGSRVTGFVAALNPAGTAALFSSYAGGTYHSEYEGIALDTQGNAVVGGFTDASDAATTTGGVTPSAVSSPVTASAMPDATSLKPQSVQTVDLSAGSTGQGTTSGGVVVYPKASAPLLLAVGDLVSTPAVVGSSVTYTLTAGAANGTATSVVLTWTPSPLTTISSASSATFACTKTASQVTCTLAALNAGDQPSVTIVANVVNAGTVTDGVTLTAANASNSAINSSSVSATASANLAVTYFTTNAKLFTGQRFNGQILITNSGPSTAYAPQLTVNFSNLTTPVMTCGSPTVPGSTTATCTLKDIPPGSQTPFVQQLGGVAGTSTTLPGIVSITVSSTDSPTATDQQNYTISGNSADLTENYVYMNQYSNGALQFYVSFANLGPGIGAVPTGTITLSNGFKFNSVDNISRTCPNGLSGLGTSTLVCNLASIPAEANYDHIAVTGTIFGGQSTGTLTASILSAQTPDPVPGNNTKASDFKILATPPQNVAAISGNGTLVVHPKSGSAHAQTTHPAFTGPAGASGVAFDFAGDIWVAGAGAVVESDSTGALLATFTGGGLGGSGNATAGIALDGDGKVWVPNTNGTVTLLGNLGTAISPATGFAAGLNAPAGIAIDNAGSVWIANSGNNSVTRVFGAGAPVVTPLANANANASFGVRP